MAKDTAVDSGEDYYMKITMETGRHGRGREYQQTVFLQNYSDHATQIKAMQVMFPAVAERVAEVSVAEGNEGLKLLK